MYLSLCFRAVAVGDVSRTLQLLIYGNYTNVKKLDSITNRTIINPQKFSFQKV